MCQQSLEGIEFEGNESQHRHKLYEENLWMQEEEITRERNKTFESSILPHLVRPLS